MSRRLFFITHADVVIDPDVPVPDWGLSERGTKRHAEGAALPAMRAVTAIYCSAERKARDGASILVNAVGGEVRIVPALHENDRSTTGFLPRDEFEQVADAFFANPDQSIRGWETARAAQARIVAAVSTLAALDQSEGDIAVVAHGAVGALLLAHSMGAQISRELDQPGTGGGNVITLSLPGLQLLSGWRDLSAPIGEE